MPFWECRWRWLRRPRNEVGLPLYSYLGGVGATRMPVPMMNILNGGVHASDSADFQEFMIVPAGFTSFSDALRAGVETYHSLGAVLANRGLASNVGDEGGFAPALGSNVEAVELILEGIDAAGFSAGSDIFLALDAAATEFHEDGRYVLKTEGKRLSSEQLVEFWGDWRRQYPIISIEDGLDENDWDGWKLLCASLGRSVQLVADDLTVTNTKILSRAIEERGGELDPDKGESNRFADGNPENHRDGPKRVVHVRGVASLGRDRRYDYRRLGSGDRLRSDKDGRPGQNRPRREIQPASPNRGRARAAGGVWRPWRVLQP